MYFPQIKNIEQITKDPSLKAIKPWWMILLGAAILYLVPAQAVLELPMLGATIEWFASLVPSIARWVELSPFPYNTKLFFVFVWLMIPVQVYWLVTSVETRRFFQASYLAKSTKQLAFVRFVLLLCALAFFGGLLLLAYYFAIVDTPPCRVCVNTTKWAQLFIGGLSAFAFSEMIVLFSIAISLFFNSVTSKGK